MDTEKAAWFIKVINTSGLTKLTSLMKKAKL